MAKICVAMNESYVTNAEFLFLKHGFPQSLKPELEEVCLYCIPYLSQSQ